MFLAAAVILMTFSLKYELRLVPELEFFSIRNSLAMTLKQCSWYYLEIATNWSVLSFLKNKFPMRSIDTTTESIF